jgi:hypothetical protein
MNSYLEAKSGESRRRGSTELAVITRSATLPATTGGTNPFLAFAASESGQDIIGKLIKFSKGDYLCEKAEVPSGSEFLAAVDALVVGWQRWVGKQPIERRLGRLADGFREPEREELGHLDESQWELDSEGRPQDPWAKVRYLPMKRLVDGELFTLTMNGKGRSGEAIGRLCGAFGRSRHSSDHFPIIRLGVEAYEHKVYGRIKYPALPVVGWRPRQEFGELETGGDVTPGSIGSSARGLATVDEIPGIDREIPF